MRYLSLFSGIEACTVAWKPLGWQCVAVAEIEAFPSAVLAYHYPNTPNLGDVTKLTENDIKQLGQIDLVVFGSPCQDLSIAGNRQGFDGDRSGLFRTAMQITHWARKHNGCRFALWENVLGAFSSNKGRDFTEVVRTMAGLSSLDTPKNGWGKEGCALGDEALVEWCVLDSQWRGLAQRRKRVFALADFGNWQDRPPILLEPQSLSGDSPPGREMGRCVATDVANRTFASRGYSNFVTSDIAPTLKSSGGFCGGGSEMLVLCGSLNDAMRDVNDKNLSPTLRAGKGSNVPAICRFEDGSLKVRKLTPVECERLQGFADNYTQVPYRGKPAQACADTPRYKALGNSMAVPVMRYIGERIKAVV